VIEAAHGAALAEADGAPVRREETLKTFETWFIWLGVIHAGLALVILQQVIDANLAETPKLGPGIWWPMLAYAVFFTGWLVGFCRRFRLPADA